jgi:hypothetical protein
VNPFGRKPVQKSIFIMLNLAVLTFSPLARAEDKEQDNNNDKPMLVSDATQQVKLKNYAPFMRNMVMAAGQFNSGPREYRAARIMRGGKQVIVLGGP